MRKIKEVWKRIKLSPSLKGKLRSRYEISNQGRIRSIRKGVDPYVLQLGKVGGYLVFNMPIGVDEDGKKIKRNRYVHRIVAEYFCENWGPKAVVIHKDHNKLHNDYRNLLCTTQKEAIAHRNSVSRLPMQELVHNIAEDQEDFEESTLRKVTLEEEIFKTIEGFSRYEISNKGKIRKRPTKDPLGRRGRGRNMEMKQRIHPKENFYFLDLIDDNGKRRTVYPHKEVAKAYCINVVPEERGVVVHLDGNTLNNSSDNLDWASYSEAIKLQFKHGKKDNFKVWEKRKKLYQNGFKPKAEREQEEKLNEKEA
ncbi:MAG: NUMOD4 motif-containing HNH endonuclease [Cytophagales bacterium]|nr:NUMOD4 motif-containing HNH endonuclease [Cytophagales bacterium]